MRDCKNLSTTHGFSLLELLLAVGVMAIVIVGVAGIVSRQSDDAKANVLAMQLKTVGDAAGEYIKDNYSTLLANTAPANSKVIITLPMLTATGYLATAFNANNTYGQNTCVVVRRSANSANNLLGLVVTEGGAAIDDLTMGQISATVGGSGGGVYAQNPAQVTGTLGAWAFPIGTFAGATTAGTNCSGAAGNIALTAGHPTMSLWFADGASRSASGTLYRNAVAGQPELNTMNTALLTGTGAIIPDTQIGQACNTGSTPNILGAIATAQDGSVVSCVNNVWTKVENKFWGAPADTIAALGICNASKAGETRMIKSAGPGTIYDHLSTNPSLHHPYVPYTCDGTGTWKPIAIDQSGHLEVESLTSNVGTNLYGPTTIGNPSIGSPSYQELSVFSHTNFYNGLNVRNKNVNLNADADAHAYDPEGTASINVYGKGDINLYTGSGKLRLSRYMSFSNQVPPSTIGTFCSNIEWGKAVTMTTEGKLISCQNGIWALATTPDIGTTMYLSSTTGYGPISPYNQPSNSAMCPLNWYEIDFKATDFSSDPATGNNSNTWTRTCHTSKQCDIQYLRGQRTFSASGVSTPYGLPATCPGGYSQIDYKTAKFYYNQSQQNYIAIFIRTCMKCPD